METRKELKFRKDPFDEEVTPLKFWKNVIKERTLQTMIFVPCYLAGLESSARMNRIKYHLDNFIEKHRP
ncbi:unnamed protein product [Moneuplotes crassus]|uniref:Uncharacterized protein n=1 Tax=Euplotes crassus TaxID=5936 RepID=A0AAD1Y4R8_EUPCR|nr:unnamed protein product [Moneuplotes crassus]